MKNNFILFSLILCLFTKGALANNRAEGDERSVFTELDWQVLRIDSTLPYYTEVIPLQTDYRTHKYTVTLEYPQYTAITNQEKKIVSQYDSLISHEIVVRTHVGEERGRGLLDIDFLPFIKKDDKYLKLLSASIVITATPSSQKVQTRSLERYTRKSKLSDGLWVKISIQEDGMYRLTRSALRAMGFSKPENVHLYGYGGHRQEELINASSHYDDIPEVPLYYAKEQDSWLFWGNGLLHWIGNKRVRNVYANAAYYFLREESTPNSIETVPFQQATPFRTVENITEHELYEKDEYAWAPYGSNLYDGWNFNGSNGKTYQMQTYQPNGDVKLEIAITGFDTKSSIIVTPTVNGKPQKNISIPTAPKYAHASVATQSYDLTSQKLSDSWPLQLTTTAGKDVRLDYIAVHYSRPLSLRNGFVCFGSPASTSCTQFRIKGKNLVTLRKPGINTESAVITGAQSGEYYTLPTKEPSTQFVAFSPSYAFPQPNFVGYVSNQNLHALDSVDMVIIIPSSGKILQQAKRLAEAHKYYDGLRCAIVSAAQVYNEFSSGTPDATAYRRLMKMLYDRGLSTYGGPRYLLLMGDAAWDNRMLSSGWKNSTPDDYLLCYESDNSVSSTSSYVMEDYFALLGDGEGADLLRDKPDIGVGRFPVVNAEQARIMVDKVINYLEGKEAGAWRNTIFMLGDDGDNNGHMKSSNKIADEIIAQQPNVEVNKVMWDAYDRVSSSIGNRYPSVANLIKKNMREGAMVMNYMGHGNQTSLSHEFVINLADFAANKTNKLGLWVTAACDIMPFDGEIANIGETAVLTPEGGALAFYGTTRTVYATQNETMNQYFMRYLLQNDASGRRLRIGDAIYMAKNAIISGGGESIYKENKLQYVLLGDPALVIGKPLNSVVLDSINGIPLQAGTNLKAGEMVRLTGHIENSEGVLENSFKGVLDAHIFDNVQTITCKNNAGADVPFKFDTRKLIIQGRDSVRDGRFNLSFVVPVDINYSHEPGRVCFYAVNEEHTIEASGHSEEFSLSGRSDDIKRDTIGPSVFLYLDTPDFISGSKTHSTPYLVAHLKDESGINYSGNGIGHDIELSIDDDAFKTYNLNEYYQPEFGNYRSGSLGYSIPKLQDGPHYLKLRSWDVLGNSSLSTLSFVVDHTLAPTILRVTASQNPAVSSTTFMVHTNRPGTLCRATIDVYDCMGRRLWTKTEVTSTTSGIISIPYNFGTGGGNSLGTGVYLYRCTLQCGGTQEVTQAQKLIVINNK